MVNKENYYREYKGHKKWLSLISSHFAKNNICIVNVCAKYQRASLKALVQVDFLMYAMSKHKHNPYFNRGKMAKITKLSFCQKLIFWHQTFSHKCSMCLYYAKYKTVSAKAVVQVDFPAYALSIHKQYALRITKNINQFSRTNWHWKLLRNFATTYRPPVLILRDCKDIMTQDKCNLLITSTVVHVSSFEED